ncbi:leucyl aminopeptidase [Candidatus Laterigemmans baculatus]|uniref:leucyl aminopeptidase n=1 Tax=Candidatus Laterigemmans baculatus TaxID=2770505 RepID=UPI0013DC1A8D|nr:leucyl aminopeptidase [Candidatus Laterigemmans baculatus]
MKTSAIDGDGVSMECDALVIGLDAEGKLGSSGVKADQSGGGWLSRAIARGDLSGKRGEAVLLPSPLERGPAAFLVVGTGDATAGGSPAGAAFEIGAAAMRRLADRARGEVVFSLSDVITGEANRRNLVCGAVAGTAGQDLYQRERKLHPPASVQFAGFSETSVREGTIVGEAMNLTRRLVNEPACVIYPSSFADEATKLGEACGLEVEVWDESRLEQENCRALLAVGRGSARESRLVKLRYQGAGDDRPPIALVGKGVTFDSGGLSIKPSDGMLTMKCDMAGAATVLGVISAAARLGIKENIVGLVGLAENMVAGDSFKLGDVLHTRSGKTVEVHNTDAEGRLVLADTLDVALEESPRGIVDLATLTGACVVALGVDVCGLFTNNRPLLDSVRRAAGEAGEPVWELPMFDFYAEQIRSKVADIKNVGEGRWGGAITAAKFLEEFVAGTPWVHIDIAGPAFADNPKPMRDAGATGVMVRSLVNLLENG